ncbi:putative membrane protein [Anaeroplasma bactoclasticum]|jgi:uncharacterized membrane protein|uniref:Putative membrane protein n=1 Tax=Anaeroplasma bactoclasticum TaxID=2088 RepID=A0A397R2G8_9MOLU|nr:DUF1700 domain-containing protein [Anaeroplasma bactoclasticum]RIA66485.1 putative membrane protein [Anaeroplasma bactoclasticum]
MTKKEFFNELESRLQGLPKSEIDERINFYDEMIQDMMEEGKTEEEAIQSFGGVDEVVLSIAGKTKMTSLVKERIRPKKRISAFGIVLIILGFPIWLPLLIVFSVLVGVGYMLLWVLILVTYTIEAAFIAAAGGSLLAVFLQLKDGTFFYPGVGVSILVAGIACLFFPVCIAATKANIKITKKIFLGIKHKLIGGKKNA